MYEENKELSTASLIDRINDGQDAAREELFRRCLPVLRRFAHGRLPAWRRDMAETDDIVQVTLMRALNNLDRFKSLHKGAFFGYLRQIMLNAIRDELRKQAKRPPHTGKLESLPPSGESAAALAVGEETLDAYEKALTRLAAERREAVVMRVEFDMSYAEIALELGSPSANAARMQVARGLKQVAEWMP